MSFILGFFAGYIVAAIVYAYRSNEDSRSHSVMTGAYGYSELEWEAFQYGWNAAKKHFGIEL